MQGTQRVLPRCLHPMVCWCDPTQVGVFPDTLLQTADGWRIQTSKPAGHSSFFTVRLELAKGRSLKCWVS